MNIEVDKDHKEWSLGWFLRSIGCSNGNYLGLSCASLITSVVILFPSLGWSRGFKLAVKLAPFQVRHRICTNSIFSCSPSS